MKQIAVLGCGTVGSGVVEVFYKNRDSIERRAGCPMDIKWIYVRRPHPEIAYQDKLCFDFDTILNDDDVQVVVEVMGGLEPAYRYIKSCLQHGKNVVTANKELIAQKGSELLGIARQNKVKLLFEASVGGGIPIIKPLHQCLGANEIDHIEGILNGTTNFILTKMRREHMSFPQALEQAQQLGYAESDPTADIEGIDACRKICILASLAYGKQIYPQAVHCEGITGLTLEDMEYAEDWGGVIKLIAKASRTPDRQALSMLVAPMFVSDDSQLSGIDDVFNGILIDGDATGEVLFYGKGAGKLPTASAVISDVIDCTKGIQGDELYWEDTTPAQCLRFVRDWREQPSRFYLRLMLQNRSQLPALEQYFAPCTFLARKNQPENEAALITSPICFTQLEEKLENLQQKHIALLGRLFVL